MANEWEVNGLLKSNMGAAFKAPITEPLVSGPQNDFSLPKSFSAELAALKGQRLLDQLAAELKAKTAITGASRGPQPAAEAGQVPAQSQSAPFVDMMMSEALLTRTENNAVTYAGSGNPLVDFFFQVVEDSQKKDIDSLLDRAWEHAPMETLQLVAHLRDVREGKGERERGWDAYIWLAQKHPRTLLVNLPEIVKVGFWKDLLQLLQRLCVGEVGWQAGAEQGKAQRWSSAETRKKRRLGKQERLREWKASLKEAAGGADPGTLSADSDQPSAGKAGSSLATQPQAAGKALSWRARLKDTRNSRARMYANRRRAARARVQRTASENLGQPSGGVAGPFAGAAEDVKMEEDAKTKAATEVARMRQERADHFAAKLKADMDQAAEARHQKALQAKRRVHARLEGDAGFRLLYAAIARTFADQLRQDLADLQVSSLCAKWAPTPKQAHDKETLIATAIAELLYPAEEFRQPGMSACNYTELTRRSYAKEYLRPLREAAAVPETKMSQGKWEEIDYERVASLCMKINKPHFGKHDRERLTEYLEQVKKGEKKIASGALKPHELVEEAMGRARASFRPAYVGYSYEDTSDSEEGGAEEEPDAEEKLDAEEAVMEAQWKSYVDKLRQSGQLSSCLAVADVSGSMGGQPMNVAIALSLLTAAVAKPPFNQLICTFSEKPQLHLVKGATLVKQVQDVSRMEWGMNTNVDAVFNLILQKAVAARLLPEDMVSTIFIFSDMEFDQASANAYDIYSSSYSSAAISSDPHLRALLDELPRREERTNFQGVKAKYEAADYRLPQVVFWNLAASRIRGQKSTPVQVNEKGVALVSGFSGQLLKLFMDKPGSPEAWKEEMSPEAVMTEAIKGKGHYDSWHVMD